MANAESFPRGLLITAIVLPLIWSGIIDVFDASSFLGRTTRDLFDHIALLDQWSISISEWNFPTGGRLVPPDIFGMLLAQLISLLEAPQQIPQCGQHLISKGITDHGLEAAALLQHVAEPVAIGIQEHMALA